MAAVKPPGAKRGRPQTRTPPTLSAGRSVSNTPSSEGRSNGKSSRTETPSNMANGDNTPRRRTRRTSGMYDSDRASNEDSGNSSEDSESEDPPDKKPSPWRGRTETLACQEEEEVKEEEEQSEVINVPPPPNNTVASATTDQPPAATAPPCPSIPQEKADKVLSQSEKREAEQGEEPVEEAAMLPIHQDKENKTSPVQERVPKTPPVPEKPNKQEVIVKTSPLPDKINKMSPSTADKHKMSPVPEKQLQASSPLPDTAEDDDSKSTPLSSPRVKGRRANPREARSETPPRILHCSPSPAPPSSPSHSVALSSPPGSVLKTRQDEPMVVLHCLPTQRLPPDCPADSDTDSASEEEGEEVAGLPEDRGEAALKCKAVEQRAADKKLRPDRKTEEVKPTSPKPLPSPLRRVDSERRNDAVIKEEETPMEASEERLKEPEVCAGTPPRSLEAPGPAPSEEPQMGPEALVCHEVDLDDPDEKEKPTAAAAEHLLLMMREQPAQLPHLLLPSPHTTLLPQPQVRPFLPAAAPPCPEELHPTRNAGEEQGDGSGEPEGDADSSPGFDGSTSSSSTSVVSLQENKNRAGQKRVMDCNSSPSAKKQKRNQKRPNTPGKVEKNGAGHSSDSEDQSRLSSLSKSQKSRCPGLSSPSSHSKDKQNFPSPQRAYKWTFQLDELDNMSSTERISFLQDKLQEIRKYYMTLKSEVASIDRRRKRLKKKEREVSNTTASTSSGSSDTGMSPSSASPTQNTVAVECR
ncbi:hypothetical protein PAMA_004396 [Pampus argenteus]